MSKRIDCSITLNYLREKARLTHSCTIMCEYCELGANGTGMGCHELEMKYPEKAIAIVQKGSDDCPAYEEMRE